MFEEMKKQIDRELTKFLKNTDRLYSLNKTSPLLSKYIRNFVLRDGKRIRPILFIIGYRSFAKKIAPNLYTSALAIELLHDFMLVHDDIIDKSETRRGKPSMHAMFNSYLADKKGVKLNGQDLAIVAGDVIYAMAMQAFLAIKEKKERKEKALKKFIEATIHTATGEFLELVYGINDLKNIEKKNILKVYDCKTAYYTFACPLAAGAILAGASQPETEKLSSYGIYLGRAFQIKDDIISMFQEEKQTGKSSLSDLKEAKKTLIIWYAYHHTDKKNQNIIRKIFSKDDVNKKDLLTIRKIITESGALEYAKKEISRLARKSQNIIKSSKIKPLYRELLVNYTQNIINI